MGTPYERKSTNPLPVSRTIPDMNHTSTSSMTTEDSNHSSSILEEILIQELGKTDTPKKLKLKNVPNTIETQKALLKRPESKTLEPMIEIPSKKSKIIDYIESVKETVPESFDVLEDLELSDNSETNNNREEIIEIASNGDHNKESVIKCVAPADTEPCAQEKTHSVLEPEVQIVVEESSEHLRAILIDPLPQHSGKTGVKCKHIYLKGNKKGTQCDNIARVSGLCSQHTVKPATLTNQQDYTALVERIVLLEAKYKTLSRAFHKQNEEFEKMKNRPIPNLTSEIQKTKICKLNKSEIYTCLMTNECYVTVKTTAGKKLSFKMPRELQQAYEKDPSKKILKYNDAISKYMWE